MKPNNSKIQEILSLYNNKWFKNHIENWGPNVLKEPTREIHIHGDELVEPFCVLKLGFGSLFYLSTLYVSRFWLMI